MPHHFAVWRTSSRCSDGYPYLSTFTAAQDARWPLPQADLTNMAILIRSPHPSVRQGRVVRSCTVSAYTIYLPGSKPEVITSTAPATECLHARVARMRLLYESHPRTPIAVRWCLRSSIVRRSEPPSPGSPHGPGPGRDSLLEFHAQPLGCLHAWVWHVLVMHG